MVSVSDFFFTKYLSATLISQRKRDLIAVNWTFNHTYVYVHPESNTLIYSFVCWKRITVIMISRIFLRVRRGGGTYWSTRLRQQSLWSRIIDVQTRILHKPTTHEVAKKLHSSRLRFSIRRGMIESGPHYLTDANASLRWQYNWRFNN